MQFLTVATVTYNRGKLLQRVYKSLCDQTCKDFIWLIVDDGSTDNTHEYIEKCKSEAQFEIRYFYKENGGVHTARNMANHLVDTELMISLH